MTRGVVVWLVGLPSSGKSTLARRLADAARAEGESVLVLDGDEVRAGLRPQPGYDEAGRDAFYETLSRLAALAASQGLLVLVPATANRRAFRERARSLAPSFVEVFVDTPREECERRDPKGLWARARAASDGTLPGAGAEFEPPLAPDVIVRPGDPDPIASVLAVVERAENASRAPGLA